MFVPRAHVYLGKPNKKSWFSGSSRSRDNQPKHKVNLVEYVRMPCLVPTFIGTIVGLFIICGGAILCLMGYDPGKFLGYSTKTTNTLNPNVSPANSTDPTLSENTPPELPDLKVLTYIGPVLMGIGFFVMMVAVVLYCEIKDKYVTHILPDRDVKKMKKNELYDMIIEEFRKNYFRGIEVPLKSKNDINGNSIKKQMPTLFKALSISTPALLITPEMQRKWLDRERRVSSVSIPVSARHVERVQIVPIALSRRESWLKTSSLPNIRPKSAVREAVRATKKCKSQFVNNRDISKSLQNNVRSLRTRKVDVGFDNPAFRDSPTETIHLTEIGPTLSPESPVFSHGTHLTKVLVHMDASKQDNVMQDQTNTDARGYTLRRDIIEETTDGQDNEISVQETSSQQDGPDLQDERSTSVSKIDNEILCTQDVVLDLENQPLETGHPKNDLSRSRSLYDMLDNRREYKVDNGGRAGPHRTYIDIFRSESCLDKLHLYDVNMDDDRSSNDSLSLTEDVMKYFDRTDLLQV